MSNLTKLRENLEIRIKSYKTLEKLGLHTTESVVRLSECESILGFLDSLEKEEQLEELPEYQNHNTCDPSSPRSVEMSELCDQVSLLTAHVKRLESNSK